MSDENEQDDFEGFEDFLSGLQPGRKVTLGGGLRYREGGDARDWSAPGQTKRVPGDWMMQIGVRSDTFAAATSGMVEVSFPQAFGDPPWIMACPVNTLPAFQDVRVLPTIASAAGLEIYWHSSVNLTYIEISWMAIGPIGTG